MTFELLANRLDELTGRVWRIEQQLKLMAGPPTLDEAAPAEPQVAPRAAPVPAPAPAPALPPLGAPARWESKRQALGAILDAEGPAAVPTARPAPSLEQMKPADPRLNLREGDAGCHGQAAVCLPVDVLGHGQPKAAAHGTHDTHGSPETLKPADPFWRLSPPRPQTSGGPRETLEVKIGMRWMAWAGALFVVVAAGFFVKLAYDQGWIGHIPALGKCLLSAAFGACLLAAGELALRKVNRPASVSLFGAGLGVLYLTALASFKHFDLVSEGGAFWLLAAVGMVGVAITVRGRMLTIGVLALVGGYAAPLMLSKASGFAGALPLYMTMLLTVGLALSAWREKPFRALRYVTLAVHGGLGLLWVLFESRDLWALTLSFIALWWLMVNAEALYAARRGQSAKGNCVVSLLATIWLAVFGCWLIHAITPADANWMGWFTAGLATIAAVGAAALGGMRVLRSAPREALDRFAFTLWAQVGCLLAAAIGLHFEDVGRSIGWILLGLVCIEVGRRLPSRGVDRFGLIVGALGLFRVAFVDSTLTALHGTLFQVSRAGVGGVHVTHWTLLALGAIGATMVAAFRLHANGAPSRRRTQITLSALAVLGWMALCGAQCTGLAATALWLAGAAALLAMQAWARPQRFVEIATVVLALTAVRWMALDVAEMRFSPDWNPLLFAPLLNPQMLLGLLIVGVAVWLARLQFAIAAPIAAGRSAPLQRWHVTLIGGAALMLLGLSFQVDHLLSSRAVLAPAGAASPWAPQLERKLWITLLWAGGGLAMLVGGRREGFAPLRSTGWAVLVLCGLAWLSVDTLLPRIVDGVTVARVVLNPQFAVGLLLALMLAQAAWLTRRDRLRLGEAVGDRFSAQAVTIALALIAATGLWLSSLEMDRFFAPESGRVANAAMARQTALSIWWGIYAIALIGVGFARQSAWSRYAGLALLATTLGKVVLVDMAEARYAYRVLSFLALGLLLIVTSVAYAKLSRKMSGPAATAVGE